MSFNPILVWFYPKIVQASKTRKKSFQSHFGLILSPNKLSGSFAYMITFNPILVWFYPGEVVQVAKQVKVLSIPFWSDFIIVNTVVVYVCYNSFNPILVWFYLTLRFTSFLNTSNFQSHFGLIFSPYQQKAVEQALAAFQSHFGLILSQGNRDSRHFSISSRKIFQSHFGLILSYFPAGLLDRVLRVPFNPILVWFYRCLSLRIIRCSAYFQSHFGLILSSTAATLRLFAI